jgi:hypothetical protein
VKYPKPTHCTQKQRRGAAKRGYAKVREEYLHEHFWCEVCRDIATEIHHKAGTLGSLYTDKNNFLAVCPWCHHRITNNPLWAIEQGYSENRLGAP